MASANLFTGNPSGQWFVGVIVQTFIEKIDLVLFPLTHNNILDPFHFIKIDTNKYILINVVNRLHRSKSAYFEESVAEGDSCLALIGREFYHRPRIHGSASANLVYMAPNQLAANLYQPSLNQPCQCLFNLFCIFNLACMTTNPPLSPSQPIHAACLKLPPPLCLRLKSPCIAKISLPPFLQTIAR